MGTVFWAPSRRAVMSAESLPRPQLLPWPGGAAPFSCQPWMWLLISGPWPSSALLTPSQVTLVKVPLVACVGLAGGCGKHGTWGADLRKLPLSGLSRCPTLLTPPGPVPMSPFLPRPCCSFSLDSSLLPASSNVGGHLLLPFQSCGCPHSDGAEGSPVHPGGRVLAAPPPDGELKGGCCSISGQCPRAQCRPLGRRAGCRYRGEAAGAPGLGSLLCCY